LLQQTGAAGELTQHTGELARILDVDLVEAGSKQRIGDIKGRRSPQPASRTLDAFELNYRGNTLF
jgi:hypothetical protein